MLFTINEINHNPALLPNLTLGFGIIDSCNIVRRALQGITQLTSRKEKGDVNYQCRHSQSRLLAIIGDAGMAQTVAMAQLLGLYRLPQIPKNDSRQKAVALESSELHTLVQMALGTTEA
ncbi:hypothetical protein NDU88_000578 [Pleurodeles waltl]|uniref:Receptor ligand binding region domain-containing protein n=1 Tax=Pleurodeles waltl TaxID=8319 RepID=A0AAV7KY66_PLEWA|nr:hypothetical protein NDU88_000578 [Pleurodeles waltl]